jgi:hypothetical protein
MGVPSDKIFFNQIIAKYNEAQGKVARLVNSLSQHMTSVNPGSFMLLQFQMGNLTQIGDSISNVISSMNGIAKNSISNMRG